MCLLAVAFRLHPEAPIVIAANRDEWLAREAEPMQVLRPAAPRILGGRDVPSGGTWLAINEHGVCAGLTNRPSVGGRDPSRRSRGELPLLLAEHTHAEAAVAVFERRVVCSDYNPCWLLVCDRSALFYIVVGDSTHPVVAELPAGLHVLGNEPLDAASAKVEMVKRALGPVPGWHGPDLPKGLRRVLQSHDSAASVPDDAPLNAGLRRSDLQAACVHTPAYGTRSATVVVVHSEPDVPAVYYADGPPCRAPLVDQSCLWGASPKA